MVTKVSAKALAGPDPVFDLTGYTAVPGTNVSFSPGTGSKVSVGVPVDISASSSTKTITQVLLYQVVVDPADVKFLFANAAPFSVRFAPARLGTATFLAFTLFSDMTYTSTLLSYALQTPGPPSLLNLVGVPPALTPGMKILFGASAVFQYGAIDVTQVANYTVRSGNTAVITVGSDGTISAIGDGVDWLDASYLGLTASAQIAVSAVAAPTTPLNVVRTGTGTVISNPSGIACGTSCSATFGGSVTLQATPAAGAVFSGWIGGGCSGTHSCTLTASGSVTATFTFVGVGSANANGWVQESYFAYYGRPADPAGLAYWANRMDIEGGSLSSIIAAFGSSDEFSRRYGGLRYARLVTTIYQQALGRDPEQGGLDYYVGELQAGRKTLQSITLDVLNGATGLDAFTVANRLDVANHYTGKVAVGCPYGGEVTGVASLTPVTSDSSTAWAAKLGIESRCGI